MAVRRKITKHEELRRSLGYTVTALARKLGYSHALVSQIEGGQQPSAEYRRKVARLFRVPEKLVFPNEPQTEKGVKT
jgi:transcriptional regulator with XRE-family HTH domain